MVPRREIVNGCLVCSKCGKSKPISNFTKCSKTWLGVRGACKDCHRKDYIEYARAIKMEVLSHYSDGMPICRLCGVTDIDVLTIDHIVEWGGRHKKLIGGSLGLRLYNWLKKNDYPEGYQVLCFNCNFKKSLRSKKDKHEQGY